MTKKISFACAFLCALLSASPASAGLYTFSKISAPSDLSMNFLDVNQHGQSAVTLIGHASSPYLWSANGKEVELKTIAGYQSQVIALNNHGTLVGSSYDPYSYNSSTRSFDARATLWKDGDVSFLPGFNNSEEAALDVNDLDTVVGYSRNNETRITRALFWDSNGIHDLGTGGGTSASANGINNFNTIIGVTRFDTGIQNGTIWENGKITHIGTLGGSRSVLADVNDRGWAVGDSLLDGDENWHAVLWDGLALHDLGTLGGQWSSANNIAPDGTIFGAATTADERQRAVIWRNGAAIDLRDLIVNPLDAGAMRMVTAIGSDSNGAIYGILQESRTYRGEMFLLTPVTDVSEPASIGLLMSGLACIIFSRKRLSHAKLHS